MTTYFSDAHDFSVKEFNVINAGPHIADPLNGPVPDLVSRIAAGALHDSDERCDAPKCHPETRVAVQDEIYSWIVHGDPDPAQKTVKMKWVTAYQLAQHLPELKDPVAQAIQHNPLLFKKNLRVQMEALILTPLRQVVVESKVPGVVLIDGLDECEAEQYLNSHVSLRTGNSMEREKAEDQLEILQVLQEAALEPAFPFRIVIASRAERVFREFFNNESQQSSFAPPLILDEKYNPNADIALFLQAKFGEIRRRFNLSLSWPSSDILATLLDQASGQFIYAATVIRYITASRHGSPPTLLDQVLKVKPSPGINPFSHLDAFYSHILQSTRNPILAVKWLWILKGDLPPGGNNLFTQMDSDPAALLVNQLLQTDDGDAEYVLGDLYSLIDVPPSDDSETPYRPYHQSLYDFLGSEDRCGPIYVGRTQCVELLWNRIFDIYKGLPACRPLDQQKFLHFFFNMVIPDISQLTSRFNFPPSSVDCVLGDAHDLSVNKLKIHRAPSISDPLNGEGSDFAHIPNVLLDLPDPASDLVSRIAAAHIPSTFPSLTSTMISFFSDARDVSVNELKVINISPSIGDPLNDLASRIAAGALHDSDERCDAPKCHPETRVAVQGEIYSWIVHGDSDPAQKTVKIKWVTGPAGTGKSAIMGKTAFIPTLAYQLAQHLPALKDPVAQAIRNNPLLFKKNLRVQMEALILTPLRQVAIESKVPGVVLIDGVDECEAEQYFDSHVTPVSPRAGESIERTKDQDQLEILEALREASLDSAFPFRIVIASRPERVFREFFNNDSHKSSFAPNLVLDEKYNPNADIALFLQAKFSEIRRRYNLSPSWPSPEILAILLDQASGQFIYAATVIRYINTSRHGSPQILLDWVLKVKPTTPETNPFSHLDAFYTHILQSAPNPTLAVKWLWIIKGEILDWGGVLIDGQFTPPAFLVNLLLQTDNASADDAHDFSVKEVNVINVAPHIADPLNGPVPDLASRIAAGAIHDSDERCDAPKCHPETRVAVQGEIYSWIVHGNSDPAQKTVKIKWVTGPAGTGKSAIMGSVADTCKQDGVLAVTFFFASYASPDRRRKTAFIPTLAYQLAEHLPALKDPVAQAIRDKPLLFRKNLRVQMEALILTPLRQVAVESRVPGVVLVDGLDECEAEQYLDSHASSRTGSSMEREKAEDQLEILQVLQEAAIDPAFPFRIVIASRPERVFREFFSNKSWMSSFAPPLILDEKYNPNADITLFLQAKFGEIRRRYNLGQSWPSPEILGILLDQASGQFIYAATVIRYILTSRHGSPHTLLDQVLKVKPSPGINPFSHLDAFYTHILRSAPNPILAVKWLWILKGDLPPGGLNLFAQMGGDPAAFLINLFLQTDHGDAEYVLGDLHSLINVPPSDDLDTPYRPYHKSLYDFLGSEDRCGTIYVGRMHCAEFFWSRVFDICTQKGLPACRPFDQQKFLHFFFKLDMPNVSRFTSKFNFAPSSVDWWASKCISHSEDRIRFLFYYVHYKCNWYRVLSNAHDFSVNELKLTVINRAPSIGDPINDLASKIAAGAMHDSNERCDAPKCHPETRVAVQGEIYSWIVHGDPDPAQKMVKIKWVTGPAGTGKSAVMGSVADTCKQDGVLAVTFFFSSSASPDRRTNIRRQLSSPLLRTNLHSTYQHSRIL
ncbi:hypothetical protein H1R20_g13001, partial [Candolleomyces eurysporus]